MNLKLKRGSVLSPSLSARPQSPSFRSSQSQLGLLNPPPQHITPPPSPPRSAPFQSCREADGVKLSDSRHCTRDLPSSFPSNSDTGDRRASPTRFFTIRSGGIVFGVSRSRTYRGQVKRSGDRLISTNEKSNQGGKQERQGERKKSKHKSLHRPLPLLLRCPSLVPLLWSGALTSSTRHFSLFPLDFPTILYGTVNSGDTLVVPLLRRCAG